MEFVVHADKQEEFLKLFKEWRGVLVPVLKDSPAKKRKFFRWKFSEIHQYPSRRVMGPVENVELEVLPETSPGV